MAKFNMMKNFSLFFEDTALINVKRFLLRPIKHYRQLHEHDKESKKKKKITTSSFFKKSEFSSQSVAEGPP